MEVLKIKVNPDLIITSTRLRILILVDVVCCLLGIGGGRGADEEDIALPVLLVSAGPEDGPQHEEQQGGRVPESPHHGSLRVMCDI